MLGSRAGIFQHDLARICYRHSQRTKRGFHDARGLPRAQPKPAGLKDTRLKGTRTGRSSAVALEWATVLGEAVRLLQDVGQALPGGTCLEANGLWKRQLSAAKASLRTLARRFLREVIKLAKAAYW